MARQPTIVFAWMLVLLTGCAASRPHVKVAPENFVPERLNAYIGSTWSPLCTVGLTNRVLEYSAANRIALQKSLQAEIVPSTEQWREFRQTLDDLNVWRWRSNYASRIVDGSYWSVEIIYSDRTLRAKGNGNYPKAFTDYLAAMEELLGGRDFK
jgi:hypothetical protein